MRIATGSATLAECARARTNGVRVLKNDEALVNRIRQALLTDERVSERPIDVVVTNGVVTLKGTVQSYRRKLAVHDIAAAFDGCRDVINELVVEPPRRRSDDEIGNYVRAALGAHADITNEVIAVTVSEGSVTLAGHVASDWESSIAEDVAMSARGVRSVRNLLVVDMAREIEDQALSHNIRDALRWTRGLRDASIEVAVTGDTAVLSGEVDQLWQKEAAAMVVRRFRIYRVRNDLVVTGA